MMKRLYGLLSDVFQTAKTVRESKVDYSVSPSGNVHVKLSAYRGHVKPPRTGGALPTKSQLEKRAFQGERIPSQSNNTSAGSEKNKNNHEVDC